MKTNQRGKLILAVVALIAVAAMVAFTGRAKDKDNDDAIRLSAGLTGFQEVAPKNTTAHGSFHATISEDRSTITWTLTWEGLSGPPLFAHIHIGQKGVNGAVVVFFCGPAGPTNTKNPCPQLTTDTISGSFTAADIRQTDANQPNQPPAGQGFTDNHLSDVIRYILAGDGYANVHTVKYPGGEIRGQIRVRGGDD
jgi:hypothetical protein